MRPFLSVALLGSCLVLAACSDLATGGYTQARSDATPYSEARAQCWNVGMAIAGAQADAPQWRAYNQCMARNGWEDRRRLF
jgi:hypothetical protein